MLDARHAQAAMLSLMADAAYIVVKLFFICPRGIY